MHPIKPAHVPIFSVQKNDVVLPFTSSAEEHAVFPFMRLVLTFILTLAILYNALAAYMRFRHRLALRKRWERQASNTCRATFIRQGMQQYDRSFRRKLIHLVYVMPPSAILLTLYVTNYM